MIAHQCQTLYWMPTRPQALPSGFVQSLGHVEQSSPLSHLSYGQQHV